MRISNADTGQLVETPDHPCHSSTVHNQLAKILRSSHFKNSKRSHALLRYVVEAALNGDHNSLKERCIGAGVFGRDAAYDTAQDPIVRNAAIEVRKRLAQYYMEPAHSSELRIDMPIGSYLPTFTAEVLVTESEKPVAVAVSQAVPPPDPVYHAPRPVLKWVLAAAVALLVAAAALAWSVRRTPRSELEAFWEPLFRSRKTIQVCIGQPTRLYRFVGPRSEELNRFLGAPPSPERDTTHLSINATELVWVAPEYLFMRDALSAFSVASLIQSKGRAYQLMSVSQTNYSRLRGAPMVAIGAFNNQWSMRATAELRFVLEHRTIGGITYNCIIDRQSPNAENWKVKQPLDQAMAEDFAVVTRVFDPANEETVISAAGIEAYGTLAASEFITGAEYVGAALAAAPRDWRGKNVQFVLGTTIIDGTPGPPRILAAHFW